MKKFILMISSIILLLAAVPHSALAADLNLIKDVQISLKASEKPSRLEVSFDLTEPISLSQANSDIIIEYFTKDSDGNLEATGYRKDKSWSGYLNSYESYPSGELKYSSGHSNGNYSDDVPATRIYTSTRTGADIDVTLVMAVKITALRADGSGETVTISIDGSILKLEYIEKPYANEAEISVLDEDNVGIKINTAESELPADTVLVAREIRSGPLYEKVGLILTEAINFVAIDIVLELDGNEIKPNGKIEISIPIPENIRSSNASVFRIEDNGDTISYPVIITEANGIEYATFETEHFSIYVLAETHNADHNNPTRNETSVREKNTANSNAPNSPIAQIDKTDEENETSFAESPATGATSFLDSNMIIAVLALGASTTLFVAGKKRD